MVVAARVEEGEREALLALEGGVRGVLGVRAGREEGDGDGEFGAEEEEEVEEAGPSDWGVWWSVLGLELVGVVGRDLQDA